MIRRQYKFKSEVPAPVIAAIEIAGSKSLLARQLNLKLKTVCRWADNERYPSPPFLKKLITFCEENGKEFSLIDFY